MNRGWAYALGVMVALFGVAPQCTSGESSEANPDFDPSSGAACVINADCAKKVCLAGSCTHGCSNDADCNAGFFATCGIGPGNARVCMPSCGNRGVVCVGNVTKSCDVVSPDDPEFCTHCDCPSSMRCEPGSGCVDKAETGGSCRSDLDCKSNNCSLFAGVCRVPVGTPCTSDNCDECWTSGSWQYCSRECNRDAECGSGLCLGSGGIYTCHPRCAEVLDASCPGKCRILDVNEGVDPLYCDCSCGASVAPHPLGSRCRYGSECASTQCDSVTDACSLSGSGCSQIGQCTQPCQASSDCGDGFRCATVGAAAHCLPTCDADSCPIGECTSLPTTEADQAKLCWIKRSNGTCTEATDCQSNKCVQGECAPAGPQPNGSACAKPEDCVSKSCFTGVCHGAATLGDACSQSLDCAVGICCGSGNSAGTCQTVCK
jgi:hypothetical protein